MRRLSQSLNHELKRTLRRFLAVLRRGRAVASEGRGTRRFSVGQARCMLHANVTDCRWGEP